MSELQSKVYSCTVSHDPSDAYNWENINRKVTPLDGRDPSVTDDHTKGYNLFSMIIRIDVFPRTIWMCTNPEEGAAAWIDISAGGIAPPAIYITVAAAEVAVGFNNDLCYIVETESWYRFEAVGGAYTDNNTSVLSTGSGGNTRWLATSGRYSYTSVNIDGELSTRTGVDNIGIGDLDDVSTSGMSLLKFTGAATSITGLADGYDGKYLIIVNTSGSSITISNANIGSLITNRILTGTGADTSLQNDATLLLNYDSVNTVWRVVGGTGGGVISEVVKSQRANLVFNTVSPLNIGNIVPIGARIHRIIIDVTQAFDGVTESTLTVGDAGDASRFATSADIDLHTIGTYICETYYNYAAATQITGTYTQDGATVGIATLEAVYSIQ